MEFKESYGNSTKEVIEKEGNNKCFECDSAPANWASVNNGIVLCLNCAGEHRSYGVAISFVRSLTMDNWNSDQLKLMVKGGNTRLRELLVIYDIPNKGFSLYNSKLLHFYRNFLKAMVKDEELPNPPANSIAHEEVVKFQRKEENTNQDRFVSIGSNSLHGALIDEKNENFLYKLHGWLGDGISRMSNLNISAKLNHGKDLTTRLIVNTSNSVVSGGSNCLVNR